MAEAYTSEPFPTNKCHRRAVIRGGVPRILWGEPCSGQALRSGVRRRYWGNAMQEMGQWAEAKEVFSDALKKLAGKLPPETKANYHFHLANCARPSRSSARLLEHAFVSAHACRSL
eukprot:807796-Rhodomonas_salina.1